MASAYLDTNNYQAVRAVTNLVGANVLSVTWRIDAQPSIAEIELPRKRFHEFREYNAGKRVWVKIQKNLRTRILFNGWLTGRNCAYAPDDERVSITALDARWHMQGDFVKGRYMSLANSTYDVVSGLKTIFNEPLKDSAIQSGNGAISRVSNGVRPFTTDPYTKAKCQPYTVNEMLWYAYYVGRNWHTPPVVADCLSLSEFGIGALGDLTPDNVAIDGLDITAAFDRILKRAGLRWWTKAVDETQADLKAFLAGPNADAPVKYLYLSDVASGVSPYSTITMGTWGSTNNTEAGRVQEDYADVFNSIYAYGARKKYQDEFTFRPGWDAATWNTLKATDIANIRKQLREKTSDNWTLYKDIGRKWILDETGDFTGTPHDFSASFGHSHYALTWRPFRGENADKEEFGSPVATNPASSADELLENSVQLLPDRAGVYLSGEISPALFDEKTKTMVSVIQMLLTVEEDDALAAANDESGTATGYLVGVIDGNEDVTRRKCLLVEEEYQTDSESPVEETETEAKLVDFVDQKLEELRSPRVSSSFSIPWISSAYELGDLIGGIRGRDLFFLGQIIEIRFDFETQRTELILEDLRQAES